MTGTDFTNIIRMCATCLTYLGSLISMFAFPQGSHYEHLNLNYRLMEEVPPLLEFLYSDIT